MSTMNQKIVAVADVLKDNARQRRVTNRQELATVAGARLYDRGQKKNDTPIERYKLVEVLGRIAERAEDGVLLPALVVHYHDSRPGRRFTEWAQAAGTTTDHRKAVREVFERYGDSYTASIFNGAQSSGFSSGDAVESEDDTHPDDRDEND